MKRANHRPGYTLLEMMLAITVATVLLGINVGWIHQTMKFSSVTKQRQRQQQSLTRLAWNLRDDVRGCDSISMVGEDQLVLNSDAGLKITYTISGRHMLVEKSGDQLMVQRERYDLGRGATAVWDVAELPAWISLIVYRGGVHLEPSSAEKPPLPSAITSEMPADLHVRVGPNRWNSKRISNAAAIEGQEDSQ